MVGLNIQFDFPCADDLEDAIAYAINYKFNEAQIRLAPTDTTNIQNIIVDESFFDGSTVTTVIKKLTLAQQLNIVRPLVISILQSIDLFGDECQNQSQASDYNPCYEHLQELTDTYAKLLYFKMARFDWERKSGIDEIYLSSTSKSVTGDARATEIKIINAMKQVIKQLLIMIDSHLE